MFTRPPTLRIRSPSSTTVEFTLSNAPPPTLCHRLLGHLIALLRLLLFSGTLLVLIVKQHPCPPFPPQVPARLHPALSQLTSLAAGARWQTLLPAALAALYLVCFTGGYTEESLVVIRDLGVQISTTTGWCWWGGASRSTRSRFIPTSRVGDLWIHEGFWGFEVRFYLAVVVDGEEGLVVVFPTLLPGRRILELVWRGARRCLYEPKMVGAREVVT